VRVDACKQWCVRRTCAGKRCTAVRTVHVDL
jgi:hypothetical protein